MHNQRCTNDNDSLRFSNAMYIALDGLSGAHTEAIITDDNMAK